MTQEELTSLYAKEFIYKTDLDSLIKEAKTELARLNKAESRERLNGNNALLSEYRERKENLRKELSNLCHRKCYRFVRSMSMIVRNYPSQELINTVVEAHLYLAYSYASFYSKRSDCDRSKHSFDDLYQCASETLIYAARQYVPGGNATFVTYARRCIENRLNREIYGEKKKKTIKVDYLTIEFERVLLAKKLLINLRDCNIFMPYEGIMHDNDDLSSILLQHAQRGEKKKRPFRGFFKACNNDIKVFNKRMARCFEETIPYIKEEHPIKDLLAIYRKLLSNSLIDKVLLKEDEWVIREAYPFKRDDQNKTILMEMNRIDFYLHKLAAIKEVLDFEKDYMKEHEGAKPTEEETYRYLSNKIRKASKYYKDRDNCDVLHYSIKNLCTYNDFYYKTYRIISGTIGSKDQRKRKIKSLYLEFDKKYEEISGKEEDKRTKEENEFLSTYCKDGKRNARAYIEDSMKKFKRDARNYLHQKNTRTLDKFHSYNFLSSRISLDDVKSVYKSIATIQSLDQIEQERGKKARSPILTPEEQLLSDETVRVYQDALNNIPEEEREVIKLMITCDGLNEHTTKEVSGVLGIPSRKVISLKNRGIRKLRRDRNLENVLRETDD